MATYRMIVVGASLGGFHALRTVLSGLPAGFPVPIAVAQHRPAETGMLVQALQSHSPLRVREPNDKETPVPGTAYIAPAGYHLLIEEEHFSLSTQGPVTYARPSIDVLFESASDAYGKNTVAVILTGSGRDGVDGCVRIKEHGGYFIAQDPPDAECPILPKAAVEAARADAVLPLAEIAPFLARLCPQSQE